ncbi:hypothetical protein GCM10010232_01480 [Streptomyces amakusaensis]|uniref:Ubiquitin-like domain-containing protein n=1 Tax=Streptomyces amakusaensis TaxID=67271 RepID=A0ABW0AVE6_9ACTN
MSHFSPQGHNGYGHGQGQGQGYGPGHRPYGHGEPRPRAADDTVILTPRPGAPAYAAPYPVHPAYTPPVPPPSSVPPFLPFSRRNTAPPGRTEGGSGAHSGGGTVIGTTLGGTLGGGGGGRRRRPAERPETGLRRLVPQALVVVILAGGTSAFVASDKAVRLTVDGRPRTLHTFADRVQELLDDVGVGVGTHDLVAPAPGTELTSGDEIVVSHGRPVVLTLDGQRREVWTTARTVGGALRELGVRADGAYLSASRSAAISRAGLALDVRTERTVTFLADGHERAIRTNAATVAEALAEAGITLGGQDTTSVPPASFPRDGQTVTVKRITGSREVREVSIPYEVVTVEDPVLFAGTEIVVQQGRAGARRVTYELRTVNGVRQRPRKVADVVLRQPVTQRVHTGTRRMPEAVPGADGLNWDALARCESGGRPAAVSPTGAHGGLYQFDVLTWQALGGRGRPQDAAPAEQTFRAKKLYIQRGATPWPHCGQSLYR